MTGNSNIDFNILFKKSFRELGINWVDDLAKNDDYFIMIMNDFRNLFPDVKVVDPYMILLKTITILIQNEKFVLKKNDAYDFFIMSYKFLVDHLIKKQTNSIPFTISTYDNIVLEICDDLLRNYDNFPNNVKIQFPNLLVDIMSIIFFKTDLEGKKISLFQLKSYYDSKKSLLMSQKYSYPSRDLNSLLNLSKSPSLEQVHQDPNKIEDSSSLKTNYSVSKENSRQFTTPDHNEDKIYPIGEIAYKIAQIIHRDPSQVKNSLSTLPKKELQKLYDICNNYNKILRYGKLTELKDFKSEIESELGRSLSDKQIRHSQISIKKVQFYIENILDGKFEPHLTHGINHVKHNFEYGYRLVGLISNTKSKNKKIES
ncbi:MAG: hypothetical protein AB7U98_12950 [Candidatus Nitrosocosmicus sp.]|jgi:hypothetical protein|uniref:hypothetical protein n=1 Tax=Candidatus Nitrosocosmicus sp. FF01 TaxID=3397670 RepID=UPI0039E8AF45